MTTNSNKALQPMIRVAAILALIAATSHGMTTNSGFETAGTGGSGDADLWAEFSDVSSRSNEQARTGAWSIKSISSLPNIFPSTSQTINVTGLAGRTYAAGLWALTPSSNPITTGGARLKLIFRDSSNVEISSVDPLFFTPASGQDVWKKGIHSGVIPAGAASVVFQAMHDVGSTAGAALFLDDAIFEVLPDSTPLDGGFEIEGTSTADAHCWTEQSGVATRSNEVARSGLWSLKSVPTIANSFPNSSQMIDVSALNGRGVTATLWALTPSTNPLASGGARIKLEFFNGATSLGSAETANFLGTGSAHDTWIQGKLEAIVPPGATTLKFQAMQNTGGTAGRTIYFDDALLVFSPAGLPVNPGFEFEGTAATDATFWSEAVSVFNRSSEVVRSGSWSMKSVGSSANGFPASTQEINVAAFAGQPITAKIRALTPSANPITTGGARIKLSFRNASGTEISSLDPLFLNPTSPADTWIEGIASGTIPAGTVIVRFQVMHDVGATTGRTLYFDDASLTLGAADPFAAWASDAGLTAGDDDATDDPDNDGSDNLAEFAFNGDPLSGADQGMLSSIHAGSNANSRKDLTLTIAVRTGATFGASPDGSQTANIDGITYVVQGTADLTNYGQSVSFVSKTASADAGYELQTFRLDASDAVTPAARGFLRVVVAQP